MAFFLLCLTIFIMFFQPAEVWPILEKYQPLRNSAIFALLGYIFSRKHNKEPFFAEKVNWYFLLFVVMQVLSASLLWLGGGIEAFNLWLRLGIVYFLITQSVVDENKVRSIAAVIVFAVAYLSYYSISKYVVVYMPGIRAGGFGWYSNPNDIAIILVSVIPLALLLANTAGSFVSKTIYLGLAGMFAFNILFTGSRNGLLGLLAVGVLSLYFSERMPKLFRAILFAGLLAGVFAVGITNVLSRSDLNALSGDSSSENRIEQWKVGLSMLKDHPVFGVGPGEFTTYVRQYGGIPGMQPHNTLLQVFAESGIFGGVFFLLLVSYPLVYLIRMKNISGKSNNSIAAMLYKFICSSLAGFCVCAFFSNRYQFYILYVLIALAVAVKQNLLNPAGWTELDANIS
ncbi:MAG: hypothetical protein A2339_01570 [Elusimicrobia bacterium RIFOXYB12_FULL_50_12]|nr:MAG: hypothetical protein A2339_01570 [Elusimicrobia bacterium RIFOXYB12_FULL_50_12]